MAGVGVAVEGGAAERRSPAARPPSSSSVAAPRRRLSSRARPWCGRRRRPRDDQRPARRPRRPRPWIQGRRAQAQQLAARSARRARLTAAPRRPASRRPPERRGEARRGARAATSTAAPRARAAAISRSVSASTHGSSSTTSVAGRRRSPSARLRRRQPSASRRPVRQSRDELQAGAVEGVVGGARAGPRQRRGTAATARTVSSTRRPAAKPVALRPVADPAARRTRRRLAEHGRRPRWATRPSSPRSRLVLPAPARPGDQQALARGQAERDVAHGRLGTPVVADLQVLGRDDGRASASGVAHPERITSSTSSRRRSMSSSRDERLEVEAQQRLGVGRAHVEVPVVVVHREAVDLGLARRRRSARAAAGWRPARRRPSS